MAGSWVICPGVSLCIPVAGGQLAVVIFWKSAEPQKIDYIILYINTYIHTIHMIYYTYMQHIHIYIYMTYIYMIYIYMYTHICMIYIYICYIYVYAIYIWYIYMIYIYIIYIYISYYIWFYTRGWLLSRTSGVWFLGWKWWLCDIPQSTPPEKVGSEGVWISRITFGVWFPGDSISCYATVGNSPCLCETGIEIQQMTFWLLFSCSKTRMSLNQGCARALAGIGAMNMGTARAHLGWFHSS